MAKLANLYEDFEPTTEWVPSVEYDILHIYLPGFKKERLKVQVTSSPNLRISGERFVGDNKWIRFSKELSIPSDFDTNKISAKFERGILVIKHPKINKPAAKPIENANSSAENTNDQLQAQKKGQDQPSQEVPPKINNGTNDVANVNSAIQNMPDKEKEQRDANEKNTEANHIPGKTLEKENMTSLDGKHKMSQEVSSSGERKPVYYKQVFGGLVTEMKKPRKSTVFVMAAGLLALVLGLYVNNAIRSEESKNV